MLYNPIKASCFLFIKLLQVSKHHAFTDLTQSVHLSIRSVPCATLSMVLPSQLDFFEQLCYHKYRLDTLVPILN